MARREEKDNEGLGRPIGNVNRWPRTNARHERCAPARTYKRTIRTPCPCRAACRSPSPQMERRAPLTSDAGGCGQTRSKGRKKETRTKRRVFGIFAREDCVSLAGRVAATHPCQAFVIVARSTSARARAPSSVAGARVDTRRVTELCLQRENGNNFEKRHKNATNGLPRCASGLFNVITLLLLKQWKCFGQRREAGELP